VKKASSVALEGGLRLGCIKEMPTGANERSRPPPPAVKQEMTPEGPTKGPAGETHWLPVWIRSIQ
jgi:hypothetical protein